MVGRRLRVIMLILDNGAEPTKMVGLQMLGMVMASSL